MLVIFIKLLRHCLHKLTCFVDSSLTHSHKSDGGKVTVGVLAGLPPDIFLKFSLALFFQQLWGSVYLRWVVDQGPQEAAWLVVKDIRERDAALRSKVARLRRQLQDLEREALEVGILSPATEVEVA